MALSNATVESLTGIVGSVLALLVTYPLKTISILQALDADSAPGSKPLTSIVGVLKQYGLTSLYAGLQTSIVDSAASSGVYFYLYSWLRNKAVSFSAPTNPLDNDSSRHQNISVFLSFVIASLSGAGTQLATLPLSVITTQLQAAQKSGRGSISWKTVLYEVYKEHGLMGFWAGLMPSLVLVSNPAIQYMLYEKLLQLFRSLRRKRLQNDQKTLSVSLQTGSASEIQEQGTSTSKNVEEARMTVVKLNAAEIFVASALAKLGATVCTYPLVVVKSRLQAKSKASVQYSGTFDALGQIYNQEGWGGFFKGFEARAIMACLNAALTLVLKEQAYLLSKRIAEINWQKKRFLV